jgi:hypothetical protein
MMDSRGYPFFVLGKDRFSRSWASGTGRWTDFGGNYDPGETVFRAAAREFMEESLELVPFFSDLPTRVETVALALTVGKYFMCLEVGYPAAAVDKRFCEGVGYVQEGEARPGHRINTVFVCEIPWAPHISIEIDDPTFTSEKTHIALWSIPQIVQMVERGSCVVNGRLETLDACFIDDIKVVLSEFVKRKPHLEHVMRPEVTSEVFR